METNIGILDRSFRIAGIFLAALYFMLHQSGGFFTTVSGFICIYCFMTALTRYSPVWELFGISTIKKIKTK